jgi:hypothetical protein
MNSERHLGSAFVRSCDEGLMALASFADNERDKPPWVFDLSLRSAVLGGMYFEEAISSYRQCPRRCDFQEETVPCVPYERWSGHWSCGCSLLAVFLDLKRLAFQLTRSG